MNNKNGFDYLAIILVIIGSLAWGIYGLLGYYVVDAITFGINWLAKGVYIIVGLAGLYLAIRYVWKMMD